MALSHGTRLGPYEVLGTFGAGGQGEVYRARDTRLDRTVAIKTIKDGAGDDPGRRARVEREARILAPLSHPNICGLHDIVQGDEGTCLVMEALEGQTLATRLLARHGRGLPVREALSIAAAVADGLAFAHQHGVVHQDVKPGNIMLTPSGVKLLDFGVARLRRAGHAVDVTMTAPVGGSKASGTLPYMAPEQLRGEVDARSDLFALGAVLYEMLTGTRAFVAESPSALAARITEHDPPVLPPNVATPALARLVAKCLARDPARRWQTAADLADELRWLAGTVDHAVAPSASGLRRRGALVVAATAIALAATALGSMLRSPDAGPAVGVAFKIYPPLGASLLPYEGQPAVAFSPDGRQLAFVASKPDGTDALFLRRLDRLDALELNGTSGAAFPFWSPDGSQIAFTQRSALMRISVADQVSNVVAAGVSGRGTWGATGVILLVHNGRLKRIDVRDGSVADLPLPANASALLDSPTFLPDGQHFLYLQRGAEPRAGVYAGALSDLSPTFVIAADSGAILSQGELFFVRGSDLLAVPFDSRSRAAVGDPRIVQKGVARFNYSLSAFTISGTGAIATLVGSPGGRQLAWFTLDGARVAAVPDSEGYNNPVISRDGARVTADRVDPRSGLSSIWVVDLKRGIGSQITDGKAGYHSSAWSPEGTRLAFTRLPDSSAIVMDLATQHVTTLDVAGTDVVPGGGVRDWNPDGRSLLLFRLNTQGNTDLWLVPVDGSAAKPLAHTSAIETDGQFSPDGRWLAFTSNRTGRWETYLLRVASPGTPIPISNNGGLEARWRPDGRAIFYVALDNTLMAVEVLDPVQSLLGSPRRLFTLPIESISSGRNHYDVAPDGRHVLVVESVPTDNPLAISVMTDSHGLPPP
jgi:eukaryotic-like serine/threonine-protein kinase